MGWLSKDKAREGDARTSGLFNPNSDGAAHGPGGPWRGSESRSVIFSLVFEHIKL